MAQEYTDILIHLGSALTAGSLIGLERSYHGRPAGFRTHALVCMASALLMMVTTNQWQWLGSVPMETVRTDPTRMAQGIMTGIGFLGAGVIFKEGLTVRGLTTAASIWITATLGILYGIGFYVPALIGTAITLTVLALFRWVESHIPAQLHVKHVLRVHRESTLAEEDIHSFLKAHGFRIVKMSYEMKDGGATYEFQMIIRTHAIGNIRKLADALRLRKDIMEYSLARLGS